MCDALRRVAARVLGHLEALALVYDSQHWQFAHGYSGHLLFDRLRAETREDLDTWYEVLPFRAPSAAHRARIALAVLQAQEEPMELEAALLVELDEMIDQGERAQLGGTRQQCLELQGMLNLAAEAAEKHAHRLLILRRSFAHEVA